MKIVEEPLTGRTEDYLRGLYDVVERKGYARIKDIASEVGVQPSSASEMMKKLDRVGLVVYEKYGGVTLTPRGEEAAKAISKRHETFTRFLQIILVPRDIALKDAHVLEHQLTPETILQFTRFVDFIDQSTERPGIIGRWRELFKSYCEEEDVRR
jgi:DtxR family Mn-dependent transcriptional regulator